MNYMTETESDRFVCPMGVGGVSIHHNGVPVGKACVGRKCAGWRWATEKDDWNDKTETWDLEYSQTQGYCGFVGE
jgi:hypothetical protein